MWAYSDCGELDLGFIPGKNHAPPSSSPWEPPRWAEPTPSPAVLSRASRLFRPFGRANWLFRWECDQDGKGLTGHQGKAGRPRPATEGLEVEVGRRVWLRLLVLSSSPVWLPGQGKSGHWQERVAGVKANGSRSPAAALRQFQRPSGAALVRPLVDREPVSHRFETSSRRATVLAC
jgi:hypothetical protein